MFIFVQRWTCNSKNFPFFYTCTRHCWGGFCFNNTFEYFVSVTYTFQTYAFERSFSTETTSNTYRPVYETAYNSRRVRGASAYKMTQLWVDCRYRREVVFADARWTVEGYTVLLSRRTRVISPVVVLLLDFNKHNVMDPFSENVFNFIAHLCPLYPLRHGFPTRGHSCKLCTV